jgi:hypothetical protein
MIEERDAAICDFFFWRDQEVGLALQEIASLASIDNGGCEPE